MDKVQHVPSCRCADRDLAHRQAFPGRYRDGWCHRRGLQNPEAPHVPDMKKDHIDDMKDHIDPDEPDMKDHIDAPIHSLEALLGPSDFYWEAIMALNQPPSPRTAAHLINRRWCQDFDRRYPGCTEEDMQLD